MLYEMSRDILYTEMYYCRTLIREFDRAIRSCLDPGPGNRHPRHEHGAEEKNLQESEQAECKPPKALHPVDPEARQR